MSNIAAAAVMIPIGLGALAANPEWGRDACHRSSLVLLIAFSSSVGGLATPVGTPPNLIGIELLEKLAGHRVAFFDWMRIASPISVVLLGGLIWALHPRGVAAGSPAAVLAQFQRQRLELGALTRGEIFTGAALLIAIVLWMYPGVIELMAGRHDWGAGWLEAHFSEEMIGLLAGALLFVLPTRLKEGEFTLNWADAVKIDWGTLLLFGGGVALGRLIFETGLADAFGRAVTGALGQPDLWTVVAVGIGLSIFLSDFTSNTAAANVMVPMMLAVAQAARVDAMPVGIATCLACSFGNLLPVSTGTNALAYGTGYIRLGAMIRYGLLLDLAGAIAIWVVLRAMLRAAG
jgi:solute carrier family 13 (sodium-dependent dicarboxylate transporter), member 2/3/5